MKNIFSKSKGKKEQAAKEIVLKEFFNSAQQKKAVVKAARESAKDQKILIERYHKLAKIFQ